MSSGTSSGTPTATGYDTPNYPSSRRSDRNQYERPNLKDTSLDAVECFQDYAKERPDVVALACLGVGFILGWKLKPW